MKMIAALIAAVFVALASKPAAAEVKLSREDYLFWETFSHETLDSFPVPTLPPIVPVSLTAAPVTAPSEAPVSPTVASVAVPTVTPVTPTPTVVPVASTAPVVPPTGPPTLVPTPRPVSDLTSSPTIGVTCAVQVSFVVKHL
jgi:hypothetical protein